MKRFLISFLCLLQSLPLCATNKINYSPKVAEIVVKQNLLGDQSFFLIDVGASRGIAKYWKAFGRYVKGVGFDPLVMECKRLNSINPYPEFKYIPAYIVAEKEEIDQYENRQRTPVWSFEEYWKIYNINHTLSFNAGQELVFSNERISLDRFCFEHDVKDVDFIKVDTDGFDFGVLKGAGSLLDNDGTLGLLVESQFQGDADPNSNTFRNIDYLLVKKGFRLFNLTIWPQSRSSLPATFNYKAAGHTVSGQLKWGDALYLRDLIEMQAKGKKISTDKVLKMICLQEIHGLYDCAAELFLAFRDQLSSVINVDHCLDLLTRESGPYKTYKEHMHQFKTNPKAFFPK